MKTFLIVYGILALVSYIVFYTATEINAKKNNELFERDVYKVSIGKVLIMSIAFPITWISGIIHVIVND